MSPISSHVNNRKVLRKPYQMSVSDQAPEASAPHSPLKFWNIIPWLSWGCRILDGALSLNLSMILQVFCSSSLHIRFKHTCPEMNAIEWLGSSFRNDVRHKRSTPQVPVWLPWLVSRRTRRIRRSVPWQGLKNTSHNTHLESLLKHLNSTLFWCCNEDMGVS